MNRGRGLDQFQIIDLFLSIGDGNSRHLCSQRPATSGEEAGIARCQEFIAYCCARWTTIISCSLRQVLQVAVNELGFITNHTAEDSPSPPQSSSILLDTKDKSSTQSSNPCAWKLVEKDGLLSTTQITHQTFGFGLITRDRGCNVPCPRDIVCRRLSINPNK